MISNPAHLQHPVTKSEHQHHHKECGAKLKIPYSTACLPRVVQYRQAGLLWLQITTTLHPEIPWDYRMQWF